MITLGTFWFRQYGGFCLEWNGRDTIDGRGGIKTLGYMRVLGLRYE